MIHSLDATTRKCVRCQTSVPANAMICEACLGQEFETGGPANQSPSGQPAKFKPTNHRPFEPEYGFKAAQDWPFVALLAFIAVAATWVVAATYFRSSFSIPTVAAIAAISSWAMITSEGFADRFVFTLFSALVRLILFIVILPILGIILLSIGSMLGL